MATNVELARKAGEEAAKHAERMLQPDLALLADLKKKYSGLTNERLVDTLFNVQTTLSWCSGSGRRPKIVTKSVQSYVRAELLQVLRDNASKEVRELFVEEWLKHATKYGIVLAKKQFCLATTPHREEIIALKELLFERLNVVGN